MLVVETILRPFWKELRSGVTRMHELQTSETPCCGVRVHRFGRRPRQCALCKRTWTIRPEKRGRPVHRTTYTILRRAFEASFTIRLRAAPRPSTDRVLRGARLNLQAPSLE